jgi:hypothetical protein
MPVKIISALDCYLGGILKIRQTELHDANIFYKSGQLQNVVGGKPQKRE